MWSGASTMAQDVCVGAAGVFQGVGEDGQAVEGTVGVDGLGEGDDGDGEAGWNKGNGAERGTEDVAKDGGLPVLFSVDKATTVILFRGCLLRIKPSPIDLGI